MTPRRVDARACSRSNGAGRRHFYGCADVKPNELLKIEVVQ
jgi:hypothetical protein